jgi:hypothetical protein
VIYKVDQSHQSASLIRNKRVLRRILGINQSVKGGFIYHLWDAGLVKFQILPP